MSQATWIPSLAIALLGRDIYSFYTYFFDVIISTMTFLSLYFILFCNLFHKSALSLLRNEVTQGLGTSSRKELPTPPPTATWRLTVLTLRHQGLASTLCFRATAATLARIKSQTPSVHFSAMGESEWGQIFHPVARGLSYGKFQSLKAECYWNAAFARLEWNFLLLLNLEKQVWKIHHFPLGTCSDTADCVDCVRHERASVWQCYLQTVPVSN